MKVLIISQYFWPESFRINDLAKGLKEKGHQVTVLTGIPNYPDGHFFKGYGFFKNLRQDYHGIKIIRSPLLPRGNGKGFRLALNYLSFAFSAIISAPFFGKERFDLIFVYQLSPITVGLPAIVLKKMKSIPIMFCIQDLWPESLSATKAILSKRILKIIDMLVHFIYRGCDRILVQSQAFFPSIERRGIDCSRITYFPNSAEELYKPMMVEPEALEYMGIPEGFRIIFGGNIGAAQDFENILKAAEILRGYSDIHWVIIGDGRMRRMVENKIKERNLAKTVHLLGKRPVEAMPRYFSLADVLLVTLRKEPIFELTIPSKVQSYLACAKPIIAALDGEGARIIKEAGAGLTCPSGNARALSNSVLEMYHMPQSERKVMGMRGRDYFSSHFERNILMNQLETWMKELIE